MLTDACLLITNLLPLTNRVGEQTLKQAQRDHPPGVIREDQVLILIPDLATAVAATRHFLTMAELHDHQTLAEETAIFPVVVEAEVVEALAVEVHRVQDAEEINEDSN